MKRTIVTALCLALLALPVAAQQSPPNLVQADEGLADSILGMRQAEAMCFSTDGTKLFLTSEKLPAPLYRLDIKP